MNKLKRIGFSREFMTREGINAFQLVKIFEQLPVDARLRGFSEDMSSNSLYIIVSSEEFDEVPAAHEIPAMIASHENDNGYLRVTLKDI